MAMKNVYGKMGIEHLAKEQMAKTNERLLACQRQNLIRDYVAGHLTIEQFLLNVSHNIRF